MTNCTQQVSLFPSCKRRVIETGFDGGDITSDAGVLLLQKADRYLGLCSSVAAALDDTRRSASCQHDGLSLLRQRVYGLALGYEDLNDHGSLRSDLAIQTALGRDQVLASSSTLCRWENRANREWAVAIHKAMVDQFITSFDRAPRRLILDFDATDDRVHGNQEGRFFHGYYDHYCYLPLYVFCDNQLLVSYLRPSKIDGAKHAWAILSLLVKRLRQAWPKVKIIFRGDSGFCRWKMLSWCERNQVDYIVGIAKNKALKRRCAESIHQAQQYYHQYGRKVRWFREFYYGARTWNRKRRVIAKIEYSAKGENPRYIVTSLTARGKYLYDKVYCARGDMENRIKEQQLDLYADRTSCHRWWPNQFRLLLSSVAYVLLESIRRLALRDTPMANAYVGTIRLKLLKIGAVIIRNTRRIRFMMSSHYPYQNLFYLVANRLAPG